MAILNSITIGKGKKSLGNVTLQTLGGVTVAKQKIMHNKSNTMKQAKQRGEFKRIMSVLRKFAPLARAAYSRVKTQSAFSRFAKVLYVPASNLTPASLPDVTPLDLFVAIVQAGGDAAMVEGSKVFSAVQVGGNFVDFTLSTQFPGQVQKSVGDSVPVDVLICDNTAGTLTSQHFDFVLSDQQFTQEQTSGITIYGGVITLRLSGLDCAGDMPIISINNERIGLRAADYVI